MTGHEASVVIRPAAPADAAALRRLAALDCSAGPSGALLVAEVDGEIVVARSLADGAAIADPFRRTTELAELVRLRAAQLATAPPSAGRAGLGEWRPPPRSALVRAA